MKYKALILDIDGTVVRHALDAHPSKRVIEAIHKAQKEVHVSISTSRPLFHATHIIEELGIEDYCIVTDSTQLYDAKNKTIEESLYIPTKAIPPIQHILQKHHVQYMENDGTSEVKRMKGVTKTTKKVCSLSVFDVSPKLADTLIDQLSKISDISVTRIASYITGLQWVCIANAKATKLHGVVRIAELLHISPDEIIGVGDSYNDFPLLEACGLKIAMGNAVPELKAIADFVAPSVEDDGVATVIEKFILNE